MKTNVKIYIYIYIQSIQEYSPLNSEQLQNNHIHAYFYNLSVNYSIYFITLFFLFFKNKPQTNILVKTLTFLNLLVWSFH